MKNKLLVFLLSIILFFQTGFVCAESLIEWNDICPAQYRNAKYHKQFYKTQKTLGFLLCVSIYGLGLGIPMLATADTIHRNNYWALRKKEYDKEVVACETSPNKNMCYMKIKEDELKKNKESANFINSKKSKIPSKNFDSSDFY